MFPDNNRLVVVQLSKKATDLYSPNTLNIFTARWHSLLQQWRGYISDRYMGLEVEEIDRWAEIGDWIELKEKEEE